MNIELEDELGDILQKGRDGKSWSQSDLANHSGISKSDIARIECCAMTPEEPTVRALANALDLHAPSLIDITNKAWGPNEPPTDPDFQLVCLQVYMGTYPVKCYLLTCKATGTTAVIDTGANPDAIVSKARQVGVTPTKILLTHTHPDHAGGLSVLDRAFHCPTWVDQDEPAPSGSLDLKRVQGGDVIELGKLRIDVIATPGHTLGGCSYRVNNSVISGDVIFAGSMGRANGSFEKLYHSVAKKLLTLPDKTALFPGHGPATTVGEEKSHNPFFCGSV